MRIEFGVRGQTDHKRIFSALRKAVLGSGLPFEPAKVNKNWPRLAYGPVLGYAQESLGEYADVYLTEPRAARDVQAALAKAAGPGLEIKRVERVPYALPSVANLAEVTRYRVEGDFSAWAPKQSMMDFLSGRKVTVAVTAPNGMTREENMLPYVVSCEEPDEKSIVLTLQTVNGKSLKPEYAVAAWLGLTVAQGEEFTVEGLRFLREGLYWRDSQGGLHRI